jgi:DNA-binding FadR family transcriptional regulator
MDHSVFGPRNRASDAGRENPSVKKLRRHLLTAENSDHKRLPPERQLAEKLGMSRSSLRQALAALEKEGLIWRHVGKGTFAGSRPFLAADTFRDITSSTSPNEIMEARLVLEPKLASIAAMRATPAEIKQMTQILKRASSTMDVLSYERWDGLFHRTIAEASRNSFLITTFNMLNATREEKFWGRLKSKRLRPDRIAKYNQQHRVILNAINNRDFDAADRAMIVHLEQVKSDLQS